MNEYQIVGIVALVGFLILALRELSAHRMSMKKGVMMGLAWVAIFAIVALFVSAIGG